MQTAALFARDSAVVLAPLLLSVLVLGVLIPAWPRMRFAAANAWGVLSAQRVKSAGAEKCFLARYGIRHRTGVCVLSIASEFFSTLVERKGLTCEIGSLPLHTIQYSVRAFANGLTRLTHARLYLRTHSLTKLLCPNY